MDGAGDWRLVDVKRWSMVNLVVVVVVVAIDHPRPMNLLAKLREQLLVSVQA